MSPVNVSKIEESDRVSASHFFKFLIWNTLTTDGWTSGRTERAYRELDSCRNVRNLMTILIGSRRKTLDVHCTDVESTVSVDRCVARSWTGGQTERKFVLSVFQLPQQLTLKPFVHPVCGQGLGTNGLFKGAVIHSLLCTSGEGTMLIAGPSRSLSGALVHTEIGWRAGLYHKPGRSSCSVSASYLHFDLGSCGSDVSGW